MEPKILKESEIDYVWICDYYDGPLTGLCLVDNKLMRFVIDEEDTYKCFPLTYLQKCKWILNKKII